MIKKSINYQGHPILVFSREETLYRQGIEEEWLGSLFSKLDAATVESLKKMRNKQVICVSCLFWDAIKVELSKCSVEFKRLNKDTYQATLLTSEVVWSQS